MPDPAETHSPILSLEESIQRLKAEILSQDWRLSEKRVELLAAAFRCLKHRFTNRKNAFAVIVMANNVLRYIQKKGDRQVPGTVDLLKEAMAHIVTFYEDPVFDPEQDKKILNALYRRFSMLKERIRIDQTRSDKRQTPEEDSSMNEAERLLREAAAQSRSLQQAQRTVESLIAQGLDASSDPAGQRTALAGTLQQMDRKNLQKLILELKNSLHRAEEVGASIRQLLAELLDNCQLSLPNMESFLRNSADPKESLRPAPAFKSVESLTDAAPPAPPLPRVVDHPEPAKCEETGLLLVRLGKETIAVEEKFIAARRSIPPERRQIYLKSNTIPVKDFKRFLQSLPAQFKGCLSSLKSSRLRSIALPVMVPRGLHLPDKPGESEQQALVLCNGNWCGVLLCSPAEKDGAVMVANLRLNDGDLLRTAQTKEGQHFPLLNTVELLKREGHMVVVP